MIYGPGLPRLTMKKFYISTLILISIAVLVALAPRMLNFELIRSQVAKRLSAESGWQIDAAQLNFYWLPTPNFSLKDTTIKNDSFLLILRIAYCRAYAKRLQADLLLNYELQRRHSEEQGKGLPGYKGDTNDASTAS